MTDSFFSQLIIILGISLFATTLLKRLGQPSILAYILVGCILGPTGLAAVTSMEEFTFISEFGVVFLLFTLGLEFSLEHLISLRYVVFVIGGVQVTVCTAVFFAALYLWGASFEASLVLAGALALSSTAIVTKLLVERKELTFDHSQLAIGILLFQDLAAVLFLIITPALANVGDTGISAALGSAMVKGAILFFALMAIGKWILPLVYNEVAKARSDEIFVLTTLVIVLVSAWVTHFFHMSMALGGFVIGMMLGESRFRHQIEADIRPFKDILLGLFFVSVGLQIDLHLLYDYWFRIIASAMALLLFKGMLIAAIARALGEKKVTAVRAGIILSQGGEFAFALISLATISGIIPVDVSSFILLVVIGSMIASPFCINNSRQLSGRLLREQDHQSLEHLGPSTEIHSLDKHVIIGGYGRIGQTVAHFLDYNDIPYVAMDNKVGIVAEQREHGNLRVMYGDCNNIEILKASGIEDARLVVLSFRDLEEAVKTISRIRQEYPDLPIIVRAHHESAFEELVLAGANQVVPEMLEASFMVALQTLSLLGFEEKTVMEQIKRERDKRYSYE